MANPLLIAFVILIIVIGGYALYRARKHRQNPQWHEPYWDLE